MIWQYTAGVDSPSHWLKQNMHVAYILICYLPGPYGHWSLQSLFHIPTTASGTIFLHTNNIHLDIFWCRAPHTCVSWGPDYISVCPLRSRHTHHMSSVFTLKHICPLWSSATYPASCPTSPIEWYKQGHLICTISKTSLSPKFDHQCGLSQEKKLLFQARHLRIISDTALSFNLYIQ